MNSLPRPRKFARKRLAQADTLLFVRDLLLEPIVQRQIPSSPGMRALSGLFTAAGVHDVDTVAKAVHSALQECGALGPAAVVGVYCRLFEGDAACPVTETAYIRRDKGIILADISGFYTAFGFQPVQLGEKIDHVAVEIEFVAMLLVMLATADADDNTEGAQVTSDALVAFARDHLGDWIVPFCDHLEKMNAIRLLSECANLLRATWLAVVATNHLPAPAASLAPETPEEVGQPYECGMAESPTELTLERRSVLP